MRPLVVMPPSGQRPQTRTGHLSVVRAGQTPAEGSTGRDLATLSDDQLCRAFLAGDEAAFGVLIARHQGLVLSLVRRYAASPEDTGDLAQRAFLRAFEAARRALGRFARLEEIPFRAWLARIAINLGKNQSRHDRRWRLVAAPAPRDASEESAADDAPSALQRIEAVENARRAREAILTLPRRQREVLTLRIDGGLAFQEVADALGITVNNAKVHFHHAVKRLKAAVADADAAGGGR